MQTGWVWTGQVSCCSHAPCLGEPSRQAGRRHKNRGGLAVLRTAAAVESKIEWGAAWLPARRERLASGKSRREKEEEKNFPETSN